MRENDARHLEIVEQNRGRILKLPASRKRNQGGEVQVAKEEQKMMLIRDRQMIFGKKTRLVFIILTTIFKIWRRQPKTKTETEEQRTT